MADSTLTSNTGAGSVPSDGQIETIINRPAATCAAIWVAVVGVIAYMFMPLVVGGLAEDLGFNSAQQGFIGAAEAGGMALANAVAVFFIRRWNWKGIILASAVVMILANLVSAGLSSFALMFIARLIDGFAGGVLIALGVACQSDNRNADRVFGFFIATEMIFASIGFYLLPDIKNQFGVDGIFVALAIISVSGLLMAFVHPSRGLDREQMGSGYSSSGGSKISISGKVSVIALTGALMFFMSQGGLWTFVERIGAASNLAADSIGLALTVSSVFGILGALGANWVLRQIGRLKAFVLVLAGEVICISMLYGTVELWAYFTSMCLFIMCWSMGLPLMLSQFNQLDRSGRLVILLYAVGKLGYTLGPAIMGLLIFSGNFIYVISLGLALCISGLGVSIGLSRFDRKRNIKLSATQH